MAKVQSPPSTQRERERSVSEQSSAHFTDTQLFRTGVKMLHILCSKRLFKLFFLHLHC